MTKDEALKIENSDFNKCTKQELFEYIVVLREALEQPAQEPVAYIKDVGGYGIIDFAFIDEVGAYPVYTHPHQWQGLTDDEKIKAFKANHCDDLEDAFMCGIQFAEVMLKDKNT